MDSRILEEPPSTRKPRQAGHRLVAPDLADFGLATRDDTQADPDLSAKFAKSQSGNLGLEPEIPPTGSSLSDRKSTCKQKERRKMLRNRSARGVQACFTNDDRIRLCSLPTGVALAAPLPAADSPRRGGVGTPRGRDWTALGFVSVREPLRPCYRFGIGSRGGGGGALGWGGGGGATYRSTNRIP